MNANYSFHCHICHSIISRGLAKRTLMKTARKAGIKTKVTSTVNKYGLPTPPPSRREASATLPSHCERPISMSLVDENLSGEEDVGPHNVSTWSGCL